MKFALVDSVRRQPSPGLRGICAYCEQPATARCGAKRIWHWAHLPNSNCDPWWENETQWHRQWKNFFPDRNQEIVHFDSVSGEKHIADVKCDTGLLIELQNSRFDERELLSRECFYEDMIWIVNGDKFKKHFSVLNPLPDPTSKFARDLVFLPQHKHANGFALYWRLSENPEHRPGSRDLVRIHSTHEIDERILSEYIGHHLFDWKHARSAWFKARKRVYFDFGDENHLLYFHVYQSYGDTPLWCIQFVSKWSIIVMNGGSLDSRTVEDSN